MTLNALRISQLSEAGHDWYARYLFALDSGDAELFRPFLHGDCVMQINNDLPLYGANVILGAIKRNWVTFERVMHEPVNIYGTDRHFAVEMLWHFTRRDGRRVTIPATSFVDRGDDGAAHSIRLHADLAPVYA
jgi:hypothetical protein